MFPNLERIDWMASPRLSPDDMAVDLRNLHPATLDDAEPERKILALFDRQSQTLLARLSGLPDDAAMLAHTLKGSARAIGAFAAAEAAEEVEFAVRDGRPAAAPLRRLSDALADARGAIGVLLRAN